MAINTYQYSNERRHVAKREIKAVQDVDVSGLSNQIASQVVKTIGEQFDNKVVHSINSHAKNISNLFCDLCGSNEHISSDCQIENLFTCDDVNFLGNFQRTQQNNPYSNTYNPGWKNHLNFSWSNNNNFPG